MNYVIYNIYLCIRLLLFWTFKDDVRFVSCLHNFHTFYGSVLYDKGPISWCLLLTE